MAVELRTLEVVFDRDIAADDTLDALEDLLRTRLPEWCTQLRIHDFTRTGLPVARGALREAVIARATDRGPTFEALVERYGSAPGDALRMGDAELRGAVRSIVVFVHIGEDPLWRIGGKLSFRNRISMQIQRARLEGVPVLDWAESVLGELGERTRPAWGALHTHDEYWRKVMRDGPGAEAIGRDFARFLPGVFELNLLGAPYVELIGRDRLTSAPGAATRSVGGCVLVRLDDPADEEAWLEHVGPEHVFVKGAPEDRRTVAPAWGS